MGRQTGAKGGRLEDKHTVRTYLFLEAAHTQSGGERAGRQRNEVGR